VNEDELNNVALDVIAQQKQSGCSEREAIIDAMTLNPTLLTDSQIHEAVVAIQKGQVQ